MYKDYPDYFVKRLTKLRMDKDVSARNMSLSVGLAHGYISRIERKLFLPSMNVFFYICDYLGISPKDFFDDEVEYPENMKQLIENLKRLDEKKLSHVSAIVEGLVEDK